MTSILMTFRRTTLTLCSIVNKPRYHFSRSVILLFVILLNVAAPKMSEVELFFFVAGDDKPIPGKLSFFYSLVVNSIIWVNCPQDP